MKIHILILLILSFLHSKDLASKYKEMMNSPQIEQIIQEERGDTTEKNLQKKYQNLVKRFVPKKADGSIDTNSKEFKSLIEKYMCERQIHKKVSKKIKHSNIAQQYSYIDGIHKIQSLKQGIFESSKEFSTRREREILTLTNKVNPFSRKGSARYRSGTATMTSYDADKERMQLTLHWDAKLQTLFPEETRTKIVSLNISRDQAKKLFETQRTHNFHTTVSYHQDKMTISKMSIYDTFHLYPSTTSSHKSSINPYKKETVLIRLPKRTHHNFTTPTHSLCQDYTIISTQLNIRSYPQKTNNIIGKLYRGDTVCISKFDNEWGKFNQGWIYAKYIMRTNQYQSKEIGTVYHLDPYGEGFLSVRRRPHSIEIGRLYNGDKVEILAKRGKWYKIKSLNSYLMGWAHKKWIAIP